MNRNILILVGVAIFIDKAEDAVSAAEDVKDSATMRYLNTGRFEDQMRMHDAEDAADKAREARDSLDN